jgi:hypothetical protein
LFPYRQKDTELRLRNPKFGEMLIKFCRHARPDPHQRHAHCGGEFSVFHSLIYNCFKYNGYNYNCQDLPKEAGQHMIL